MNIIAKRKAIRGFVAGLGNTIFVTTGIAKGSGEERVMTCRQNVFSYSDGGINPCDGKEDLLPTFNFDIAKTLPEDQRKRAYRTVWLDGITSISGGGARMDFS